MALSKHFKKKIKGASIMESVIAIAIISTCSLVAFIIYLNTIQLNKSTNYYHAMHMIKDLSEKCMAERDFNNNSYTFKGGSIEKTVNIINHKKIARIEWKVITRNTTKVVSKIIPYER